MNSDRETQAKGQLISIHSGKGGVGKTHLALNLAITLAKENKKTLLIDGNFLAGSVRQYLGETPKHTLSEVIAGKLSLEDVIHPHTSGLDIVYGVSSLEELTRLENVRTDDLVRSIENLKDEYDYILIDHAAGLSEFIQNTAFLAEHCVVVTTPEPTSVSDSYAFIKVLSNLHPSMRFKTVINQVKSKAEADEVFERFYLVVEHFLKSELLLWGYVPEDKDVKASVQKQTPFILDATGSKAAQCILEIFEEVAG